MKHILLLIIASACSISLCASQIDQSQEVHEVYYDFGSGAGQSFTAQMDGLLTGIQIVIQNSSNPGTIEMYLWKTDTSGKPVSPKLATGYLNKTQVTSTTSTWYTISFDQPYAQSEGEQLAFTIFLVTSGSSGWNDYGLANTDSYSGGCRLTYSPPWSSTYFQEYTSSDWAFRTLVSSSFSEPTSPEIGIIKASSLAYTIVSLTSESDSLYTLQTCTNLIQGVWNNTTTKQGNGNSLEWTVTPAEAPTKFFKLKVQKNE